MTDSKGQQVTWEMLTENEQAALTILNFGNKNRIIQAFLFADLCAKGLVDTGANGQHLTERGRAVLAQAAPPGEPTAEVLQSDWALEAVRQATTTLTDAAIRLEAMDDYIVQLQPQLATLTAERDAALAEAKALRAALEKIAAKSDYIECPVMLEGEDLFSFGISRGLWRQSIIAREALAASEKGG